MAVKTRSSTSSKMQTEPPPPVVERQPSKTMNNTNSSNTDDLFTTGTIDEFAKEYVKWLEAYVRQRYLTRAKEWMTLSKFTSDEIKDVIASNDQVDAPVVEDCVSPVKKKQKSNDHLRGTAPLPSTSSVPPTASLPPSPSLHPLQKKYAHIKHGLSSEQLEEIEDLYKPALVTKLKEMKGEFHTKWDKPSLVVALLHAYAAPNIQETQDDTFTYKNNKKTKATDPIIGSSIDLGIKTVEKKNIYNTNTIELKVPSSAQFIDGESTKLNCKSKNTINQVEKNDMARVISADVHPTIDQTQNDVVMTTDEATTIDDKKQLFHMDCDDNRIINNESLAPDIRKEIPVVQSSNISNNVVENIDIMQVQSVPSADSDDTEDNFYSAKEKFSQSQSQGNVPVKDVAKAFMPVLSSIPGSDMKPPRNSPTIVPIGIVDSTKKFFSSSQKKQQPLMSQKISSNTVGRVLYLEPYNTIKTVEEEKQQEPSPPPSLQQQPLNENKDITNTSNGGWLLSQPAYNGNSGPMVTDTGGTMSKTLQASLKARQDRKANIERMREKSKTTNLQNVKHGTSHLKVSSSTDRIRPLNYNTINSTAASVQPPQYHQVPVASVKPTPYVSKTIADYNASLSPTPYSKNYYSNTEDEFVNYEMTDGEYDSDCDSEYAAVKPIPNWARSANLQKALEIQYSSDYPIDPDELFGECETCDLEAIFGKNPKYRKRNSSGDWTKDRVTTAEKIRYKQLIK